MVVNNNWFDDDDDDEFDEGGAAPKAPDLPAPARKYLRKLEKANKDLEAQVAEFKKGQRKSSVEALVKSKGFDPGVASVIPESLSDEAAITKWLDDNASLFAKAQAESESQESGSDAGANEGPEDEVVQAMVAMQNVMANAQAAPAGSNNLLSLIQSAGSKEELDRLIQSAVGSAAAIPR